MGWSQNAMTIRYQHLTAAIRRDVAGQLGAPLWQDPEWDTAEVAEGRSTLALSGTVLTRCRYRCTLFPRDRAQP